MAHSLQEQESELKHRFPVILLILHFYWVKIDRTALYHVSWAVLQHQHPEEPSGAERCSFGAEAAGGRGTASQSPLGPAAAVSIIRPRHVSPITQSGTWQNHRHLGYSDYCVETDALTHLCCATWFVSILWGVSWKTTGGNCILTTDAFIKASLLNRGLKFVTFPGRKRTADMQRWSRRSSRGVRRRPGGERKRIRCVSLKHDKDKPGKQMKLSILRFSQINVF